MSVFTDYTNTAISYYNNKRCNNNLQNVNNNVINGDSNQEIEKLLTELSQKIDFVTKVFY